MILEHYKNLVAVSKLKADAAQLAIAEELEVLSTDIIKYATARFWQRRTKPKGLFITGKVGRGKSMLMDLFYNDLPIKQKQRVHFHEFMQSVHKAMIDARAKGEGINQVAKNLAHNTKLLCFDEYEINDVADAMLLSKLFRVMSEAGVVFIFTSNRPPREHYKDGLQRQTYLEFCDYLDSVIKIISLDAERDYRLSQKPEADNFFIPLGYDATARLKEKFKTLSATELEKKILNVGGREVEIRAAGKIAWAEFEELCGKPLGNADYIEIANDFDILFLENIPHLTEDNRNSARRFINLIDILYENKIILIASLAEEPATLYTGTSGAFEFNRTASRLTEMRGWNKRREAEIRL